MINFATFREALHGAPIVPVLTVPAVEHAAPLATALIEGGLRSAEVTLRTPVGLKVIEEMKNAQPDLIVGAGTICSEGDVDAALKAGADFLAHRPLTYSLDKVLDHGQGDICLQQGHAHLAQGLLDIFFGQPGLAGNFPKAAG